MLQGAFSFRGRIGRLDFFLAGIVMGLAIAVAVLGLQLLVASMPRSAASTGLLVVAVLAMVVAAIWFSLSLHVRRIRDIGWSPFYVLVGWFIFQCVDSVVAYKMPWLAVGRHHHTAVGIVVNLGLGLVFLFYPGRDGDGSDTAPRPSRLEPRSAGPAARPSIAAPRVGASLPRPPQAGFGRRGLR